MARKFSKGLGGQNTKFGTIKGPITRIGIFLHWNALLLIGQIDDQKALEGLIEIQLKKYAKGQKVLKNDGNDINDDAIYGALKDRLHLNRTFSVTIKVSDFSCRIGYQLASFDMK